MTAAPSASTSDGAPDHPCDAGDSAFFRVAFKNASAGKSGVARAEGDRWQVIPVMVAHNYRVGDEAHRCRHPAAPELRHLNEVLAGPLNADDVVQLAHDTLQSMDSPPDRSDSIMCIEAVMKPPAGWDNDNFWAACVRFLATSPDTRGLPVISFVVHRDQGAAHGHALLLPYRDGVRVSRSKFFPVVMRNRFFAFLQREFGIRVDTPGKRRERRKDKRAKTLAELAATTGAGPKTAKAAAARDAALAARIDPETGLLIDKPMEPLPSMPMFGVRGLDAVAGWASGAIQVGRNGAIQVAAAVPRVQCIRGRLAIRILCDLYSTDHHMRVFSPPSPPTPEHPMIDCKTLALDDDTGHGTDSTTMAAQTPVGALVAGAGATARVDEDAPAVDAGDALDHQAGPPVSPDAQPEAAVHPEPVPVGAPCVATIVMRAHPGGAPALIDQAVGMARDRLAVQLGRAPTAGELEPLDQAWRDARAAVAAGGAVDPVAFAVHLAGLLRRSGGPEVHSTAPSGVQAAPAQAAPAAKPRQAGKQHAMSSRIPVRGPSLAVSPLAGAARAAIAGRVAG